MAVTHRINRKPAKQVPCVINLDPETIKVLKQASRRIGTSLEDTIRDAIRTWLYQMEYGQDHLKSWDDVIEHRRLQARAAEVTVGSALMCKKRGEPWIPSEWQ